MAVQGTKVSEGAALLGVHDLCEYMSISRATAARMVKRGDLPSLKVGGKLRRVRKRDVDAYVRRRLADARKQH